MKKFDLKIFKIIVAAYERKLRGNELIDKHKYIRTSAHKDMANPIDWKGVGLELEQEVSRARVVLSRGAVERCARVLFKKKTMIIYFMIYFFIILLSLFWFG